MAKTFRAKDVVDVCASKLEIQFHSGRELTGWFTDGEKKLSRVSIPKGRDELKRGTLGSIIRQLGGNRTLFKELMDCAKVKGDLIAHLSPSAESD